MKDRRGHLRLDQRASYRIVVQGWITERWAGWFGDMAISASESSDGEPVTVLTGRLTDQAALLGLLQRLYTAGLPLLLVEKLPEV